MSSLSTLLHDNPLQHTLHLVSHLTHPSARRQIARAKEIKAHFQQKQAHEGADARKAAERRATGAIVSLGLVEEGGDAKE